MGRRVSISIFLPLAKLFKRALAGPQISSIIHHLSSITHNFKRNTLHQTTTERRHTNQSIPIALSTIMTSDSENSVYSKRPENLPVSGTSVYDRLYKASTASSKCRKEVAPVVAKNVLLRENEDPVTKNSAGKVRPSTNRRPKKTVTTSSSSDGAVFNRLYNKGTASSVSKLSSRAPMKPKNQF